MKIKREIRLRDYKYCDGCPCLYCPDVHESGDGDDLCCLDYQPVYNWKTSKYIRPDECIEENSK